MLRQAKNNVFIEGILSEINIEPGSFTNKNTGQPTDCLRGSIKIRVDKEVDGVKNTYEIPVHVFASKMTYKGTLNPAYESVEKVMKNFVSIAASDEQTADRVRVSGGTITMNEYYGQNGQLNSYPRIQASFINKVNKTELKPEAKFEVEACVLDKNYETAADGTETGRYKVLCAIPQYGGKIDLVPFFAEKQKTIDGVSSLWEVKDTVKINGRLNFTSKTETVLTEVDFGEPVESVRTINASDLIITGGTAPLEGDFAFDFDEVQKGLLERKTRLEAQKEKDMSRVRTKSAPAQTSEFSVQDLGF